MITEKDILRMATLSKLEIKEEEMPVYIKELESMLGFAEEIDADLEVKDENITEHADFRNLREDKVKPSFEQGDILRNSPEECDGFIRLRKRA